MGCSKYFVQPEADVPLQFVCFNKMVSNNHHTIHVRHNNKYQWTYVLFFLKRLKSFSSFCTMKRLQNTLHAESVTVSMETRLFHLWFNPEPVIVEMHFMIFTYFSAAEIFDWPIVVKIFILWKFCSKQETRIS